MSVAEFHPLSGAPVLTDAQQARKCELELEHDYVTADVTDRERVVRLSCFNHNETDGRPVLVHDERVWPDGMPL